MARIYGVTLVKVTNWWHAGMQRLGWGGIWLNKRGGNLGVNPFFNEISPFLSVRSKWIEILFDFPTYQLVHTGVWARKQSFCAWIQPFFSKSVHHLVIHDKKDASKTKLNNTVDGSYNLDWNQKPTDVYNFIDIYSICVCVCVCLLKMSTSVQPNPVIVRSDTVKGTSSNRSVPFLPQRQWNDTTCFCRPKPGGASEIAREREKEQEKKPFTGRWVENCLASRTFDSIIAIQIDQSSMLGMCVKRLQPVHRKISIQLDSWPWGREWA